jgi:hypothetical protein
MSARFGFVPNAGKSAAPAAKRRGGANGRAC